MKKTEYWISPLPNEHCTPHKEIWLKKKNPVSFLEQESLQAPQIYYFYWLYMEDVQILSNAQ